MGKLNKKVTSLFVICIYLLCSGCKPSASRHFWYPVKFSYAKCNNFEGHIYFMTNSLGWRSWPYILEKATKKEISIGTDCMIRHIKKLPKHKINIQEHLSKEQREYLIEGFR